MAASLQISRIQIFDYYVRKRRSGESMEQVINQLQTAAQELPREDRHQLNKDVVEWEAQFEAEAKLAELRRNVTITAPPTPQRVMPSVQTQPVPQPISRPPEPMIVPPPTPAPHIQVQQVKPSPFGTRLLDPSKLAALGLGPVAKPAVNTATVPVVQQVESELPTICPKCGKKNGAREMHCYACGTILKSTVVNTQPINKNDVRVSGLTAQFANHARIFLQVRGFGQPIEVHVNEEMIVGRAIADSPLRPNIDLTPYNAANLGVSRLHAALRRDKGTITITDLESSNFTFVNGQRLYPHETRVLRHGDEVRLGKFIMKVAFKP